MAMNGANLANEIKTAIEGTGTTVTDDALIVAISNAIVTHIITNAVITTAVPAAGLLDSIPAPVTGAAVGTGTIT